MLSIDHLVGIFYFSLTFMKAAKSNGHIGQSGPCTETQT